MPQQHAGAGQGHCDHQQYDQQQYDEPRYDDRPQQLGDWQPPGVGPEGADWQAPAFSDRGGPAGGPLGPMHRSGSFRGNSFERGGSFQRGGSWERERERGGGYPEGSQRSPLGGPLSPGELPHGGPPIRRNGSRDGCPLMHGGFQPHADGFPLQRGAFDGPRRDAGSWDEDMGRVGGGRGGGRPPAGAGHGLASGGDFCDRCRVLLVQRLSQILQCCNIAHEWLPTAV